MADHPSPDLNEGDRLRFVPTSEGFQRRNRLADALLSHWTLVAGSGSWLEAHLAARLGRALGLPNLLGCGIDAAEVWELVAQVPPEQPLLVLLSDSIAADQGRTLISRCSTSAGSAPCRRCGGGSGSSIHAWQSGCSSRPLCGSPAGSIRPWRA